MRSKGTAGATIKDVAAMAGVSISTVSRALSGKTYVEEETKARSWMRWRNCIISQISLPGD